MRFSFHVQEVLVTPKGTNNQGRLTLRPPQKSFGGLGVAHFGNIKPPQKVATPRYTNDYKRVPTLLRHHFCLIPFLVMERGINIENKLSKGARCPYFVYPNTSCHQEVTHFSAAPPLV